MSDMSELMHYGTPRHSGRFPWGSGMNPYQRYGSFQGSGNFVNAVNKLKAEGMKERDIAASFGMTSTQLRAKYSNAKNEWLKERVETARKYREEKGYSNAKIAELMGEKNESVIRNWLKDGYEERRNSTRTVADILKKDLDERGGYLDVGKGVELTVGDNTSQTKLNNAIALLQDQGYEKIKVQVPQLGTGGNQKTTVTVLAPPGTKYRDVVKNFQDIHTFQDYTIGRDVDAILAEKGLPPVQSVKSDRIMIKYAEEGGIDKDGVIELRRGVEDLSLGNAKYAQVRIGVDDKYYLKGMAMYSDDMPPGKDIIFNTNKSVGTPMEKVLKEMKLVDGKPDQDNPFGASIKSAKELKRVPRTYISSEDGKEHISPINVVNEEGNWSEWSKTISAQMLAKQPLELAKRQLELSVKNRKEEFDSIMNLDNNVVKKDLLESFASDCDSTSVHLKAAGFPRQASHVILPIPTMKENEVYAPNYDPQSKGEYVALVRFPHAGTFEIPILKVNNNNKAAKAVMGNAVDAIGINPKVAQQLSGADFDGDTVLVIPTGTGNGVNIKNQNPLPGLKNFEPKIEYKLTRAYPDAKKGDPKADYVIDENGKLRKCPRMSERYKQIQMGVVSNLITDMTNAAAPPEDITLAVRHSMCVIDAAKHDLDYRKSRKDNKIDELIAKYQIQSDGSIGGASSLMSRSKAEIKVDTRKKEIRPDPETGEIRYKDKPNDVYMDFVKPADKKEADKRADNYIRDQKASHPEWTEEQEKRARAQYFNEIKKDYELQTVHRKESSTQMAEVKDARELMSKFKTPMERLYAQYANDLKAMANEARKQSMSLEMPKKDPQAAKAYAKEVESLNAKLKIARMNSPRERQAQLVASERIKMRQENYVGEWDKDTEKKIKSQELARARALLGAEKEPVRFTEREWQAVQARAITPTTLKSLIENADKDQVRKLSTPKEKRLTDAQKRAIKALLASENGPDASELAARYGVSTSTINSYR